MSIGNPFLLQMLGLSSIKISSQNVDSMLLGGGAQFTLTSQMAGVLCPLFLPNGSRGRVGVSAPKIFAARSVPRNKHKYPIFSVLFLFYKNFFRKMPVLSRNFFALPLAPQISPYLPQT